MSYDIIWPKFFEQYLGSVQEESAWKCLEFPLMLIGIIFISSWVRLTLSFCQHKENHLIQWAHTNYWAWGQTPSWRQVNTWERVRERGEREKTLWPLCYACNAQWQPLHFCSDQIYWVTVKYFPPLLPPTPVVTGTWVSQKLIFINRTFHTKNPISYRICFTAWWSF